MNIKLMDSSCITEGKIVSKIHIDITSISRDLPNSRDRILKVSKSDINSSSRLLNFRKSISKKKRSLGPNQSNQ
jgi:hypothetical protein